MVCGRALPIYGVVASSRAAATLVRTARPYPSPLFLDDGAIVTALSRYVSDAPSVRTSVGRQVSTSIRRRGTDA